MKKICKAYNIFIFLILVIVAFIFTYNIIYKLCSDERIPKICNYGCCAIISKSMEPEISVGDMIIIQKAEKYFIGEILTFREKEKLITHRAVYIDNNNVVTKGDNNTYLDEKIDVNCIEGKVIKIIPSLGGFMLFLRKPITVIIFSILLFIKLELSYYLKGKNNL